MIATMDDPAERPAPGTLALVQALLNAPEHEPTDHDLALGDELRRLSATGESQAGLAARFGISQQMVSAALRERRLIGPRGYSLATPSTTAAWLGAQGFDPSPAGVSPTEHRDLLRLRQALLALTVANNGANLAPSAIEALNAVAAARSFALEFDARGEGSLKPSSSGAAGYIETVLLAVHQAQANGTWPRLKACPAEHCQHVFYDASKNRTATWCSMAICGNRTKVRNYQQRRRETARTRRTT